MRKILSGAVLVLLLTLLAAAPALAVPPNEILIARNLQRLGVIPPYAPPRMAQAALRALDPRAPAYPVKAPVARQTGGKALGRYLRAAVVDPSATTTYTSNCLVLLVEFGDDPWPGGDPTGHVLAGPEHGSVPPPYPDDNATFWPGDFSPMHYQQMLFGNSYPIYDEYGARRGTSDATMRNYYLEMSHGTFTVSGEVADWVRLDLPESWYGADSDPWNSVDDLTGPVWRVARDAVLKFAAEHPGFDWAQYDQENPWGITGDRFDQPDGYIDHLILIHAGSDQSAGGGAEGDDAIWAHSWGIYENTSGGPGDGAGMMIPGTEGQGPQGKGIWVFNYTINPEDGDVGVFCHEFGHDLGLPDEYDYVGYPGDSTSGFWTLMGSGSWLGREWGIGSAPAPMNAWDKYALGFVAPKTVKRGKTATVTLQPAATGSATRTAVKVALPKAKHSTTLSGRDGALEWYSTKGNDLDVSLRTKTPVPVAAGAALTFRTWYDIEPDYDFGYVDVSTDGSTWTTLETFTGTDRDHWADTRTVGLAAYEGQSVYVRFRYVTDSGVAYDGWEVTDIGIGGTAIPVSNFTSDGWVRIDGVYTQYTDRYYIAEYRTYDGFDKGLRNCYQWNYDYYSWVDWFSYNRGLLLIYRDTFWEDNDNGAHPGRGGWMVVDARPLPDGVAYDGGASYGYWRPRIQVRDACFSLKPTRSQSVYFVDYDAGMAVGERVLPGKLAQPVFDDSRQYYYDEAPLAGTKIPRNLGVRIKVKAMTADGLTVWIDNVK